MLLSRPLRGKGRSNPSQCGGRIAAYPHCSAEKGGRLRIKAETRVVTMTMRASESGGQHEKHDVFCQNFYKIHAMRVTKQ
jgi:hypothetical protein